MGFFGEQKPVPLNQINEITTTANFFKSAITAVHGSLILGNNGIEFNGDMNNGFIQIPYKEIKNIRVQIAFKIYYRGFYVDTNDGRTFNFVVSKMKKVVHVLNRKLPRDKMHVYKGSKYLTLRWKKPKK